MKRILPLAAALALAIAAAPAAMADRQHGQQQHPRAQQHSQPQHQHGARPWQHSAHQGQRGHQVRPGKPRHQYQAQQHRPRALPGRAPSRAQLAHLPRVPHGQQYRVVENRIVRVNSNTAEVIAVLGLFSLLLNR